MPHLDLTLATADDLSVRRFTVEEALSAPFDVSVWARSPNPSLDLNAIVGHDASLRVDPGYANTRAAARLWTGIVAHASLVQAESTGLSTYSFRIVPRLWLLSQRRNYRIFQHLNIPDIVDKLLAEWTLPHDWNIHRHAYPPLEFKVQYGESDLDFLCRILEEAGIAFHFPDDETRGSILTLVDEPQNAAPRAPPPLPFVDQPSTAAELEYVTHLRLAHAVRPGALTIRDHDFRNPGLPLFGEAEKAAAPENRYEQYHYKPGAFLTDGHKPETTPVADDRGVARRDHDFGDDRADRALVGLRVGRVAVAFETNSADLWPGAVFNVSGHPHPGLAEDRGLLVTRFFLEGSPDDTWVMTGEAVFADAPYRPIQRTPKPKAHGVQSAVIVGPAGQEIHTDEFGRVRVQLPWDREGHNDEKSTCWMRVNQGWGGQGFGFLVLPRIGQEVIVTFEHGDPDQPVIVGRAFNATNPVPYKLPDHKTISTWKSNSSKGGGGFNEIKFEDKKGDELVYVQAEKNLRKLVKHDETITVLRHREKHVLLNETDTTLVNRVEVTGVNRTESTGVNRTTAIGGARKKLVKKDEIARTEGSRKTLTAKNADIVVHGEKKDLVDEDASLTVRGNRNEKIDGDQHLSVLEDQFEKVTGSHALEAGKEIHLRSAELFVGEGARDVTMKGPGGFVRIDASGVTIKGIVVKINAGGSAGKGKGSKPKLPKEPKEANVAAPALGAAAGGALALAADASQSKSSAASPVKAETSSSSSGGTTDGSAKTDTCDIEKVEYACEHEGDRKKKLVLPADKSEKPPVNILEVIGGPKGHGDNIKTTIMMRKPRCAAHKSQALTVRGPDGTVTKAEDTSTIEAAYGAIAIEPRFIALLWPWGLPPVEYAFSLGACSTNGTAATIRVYPEIEPSIKLELCLNEDKIEDRVDKRVDAARKKGRVEKRGRPAHTDWKISLKGKVKYGGRAVELGPEYEGKIKEWASVNRMVKRTIDRFCERFYKYTHVAVYPEFPNLSLEYEGEFKEIEASRKVGAEWKFVLKADPLLGLTAKIELLDLLIEALHAEIGPLATALQKIRDFAKNKGQKLELYVSFTGEIAGEVGATKKADLAKAKPSGAIEGKLMVKFAAEAELGGEKWGVGFKVGAEVSAETGISAKLTVDNDKKGVFFNGKLSIAECKFEYSFYVSGSFVFEIKESREGEYTFWDEFDVLRSDDHYIFQGA